MKPLIFLLAVLASCNDLSLPGSEPPKKDATTYSFACLDSSVANDPTEQRVEKVTGIIRDLAVSKRDITDSVQTAWGAAFHKDLLETGESKLVTDKAIQAKLDKVLQDLLAQRSQPSAIRYYIYTLDDTTLNAFTFGGRIYVTKAMWERCKNDDALLYAIVGHEIGHSEAGHIKQSIQDMELADKYFGDGGSTYLQLKSILTASFNQKNELEADYYGINLTNKLGFDLCTVVNFWREMAGKENEYSRVEDFLRTHPFSQARAQCLSDHIRQNFGKDCGVTQAKER
ncbi:M48 family metallopeptidase [Flaviaesturariibacter terrae]